MDGIGIRRALAYSISSARDMPQLRAGASTVIDGIERADAQLEPQLVVRLAVAAVRDDGRAFHARDLDQLARDQRPAERGGERIAVLVERAGLQRGQDVLARELLAHVEDVRADRAHRERALADVGQLAPLPEIERHRDHLGVVLLGQPRDRDRRVEPPEYARTIRSIFILTPSPTRPAAA